MNVRKYKYFYLLFSTTLFCFYFAVIPVLGCSLAVHTWEPIYASSISLDAPITLAADIDRFAQAGIASAVSSIYVFITKPTYGFIFGALLSRFIFPNWPIRLLEASSSILNTARTFQTHSPSPVLVRLDNTRLRLAIFRDRGSKGNCFLFVIAQQARSRAILPSIDQPWAQEFESFAWISCIFHLVPLPGHVISIDVFPINGHVVSLFENPTLVENLLSHGLLTPRQTIPTTPQAEDIPLLPESVP